jgi:hypothetical protein
MKALKAMLMRVIIAACSKNKLQKNTFKRECEEKGRKVKKKIKK